MQIKKRNQTYTIYYVLIKQNLKKKKINNNVIITRD